MDVILANERKDYCMNMKVCYVTHLPNLTGANQSMLDILSKWDEKDVEPVVLLGKHGPIENELKKLGVRYKVIPYATAIKEKNFVMNVGKVIKNIIALPKIRKFYREEKFDLIHNNTSLVRVGIEAAYKENIKYICHLREFIWEDHKIKLIEEKKQYYYLNNAQAAIAISDAVKNKFSKILKNIRFETIHDGIDIKKYYQNHDAILSGDVVNILIAGRIVPGKGQFEAIKAMRELKKRGIGNVKLQVVGSPGDKEYYAKIKQYAQSKKLNNVEFIEFTNELDKLRSVSDINLVCSSAEALGRVTIESMLSGCLTIGAAAGATVELINDNETGILYEQGNSADLADKIVYAIKNKEEMNRLAKSGQKWAEDRFNAKDYNEKIYDIYISVLK